MARGKAFISFKKRENWNMGILKYMANDPLTASVQYHNLTIYTGTVEHGVTCERRAVGARAIKKNSGLANGPSGSVAAR